MKQTREIMGMPILVEIVDSRAEKRHFDEVYSYFIHVDTVFSTYKKDSEVSRFNRGELTKHQLSNEVIQVLQLAEDTKQETNGYFDIRTDGGIDPSGIVKGWAIYNASEILKKNQLHDFLIDAGGDIQVSGKNSAGEVWKIGIRNPFKKNEIIKVLRISDHGVATSGTYQRGQHIYNPHKKNKNIEEIKSITVIGPNIYDADRFATAAFAMGKKGIYFIENLSGFEGYMIDNDGKATMTTQFQKFVV